MIRVVALCSLGLTIGCGERSSTFTTPDAVTDSAGPIGDVGGEIAVEDTNGLELDALTPVDATPPTASKVYANTDKDLWQMDPLTKSVTRIGAFVNADGSAFTETMTDVAVNLENKLWGCSIGKVYELSLPPTIPGDVRVTPRVTIPFGTRIYALAIAPKGVLGAGEELVGGDAAGDLHWLPASGSPVKLGGFGTVGAGDPGLGTAGNVWQLSGDIAFFPGDGAPIGLATIRPCDRAGDPTTCKTGNDVLVEIDVAAMSTKSGTANLKKRFIGTAGTGYGRLYGVGAWGDKVYAFQRVTTTTTGTTALLVEVSLADGRGTTIRDFPDIAAARNGWSGAGVTTGAKVFIPK